VTEKQQKIWYCALCLWALTTMWAMAPMSIGAGIFTATSFWFIAKIPKEKRDSILHFLWNSPYGKASIFLLAVSAFSITYAIFFPPLGIPVENPFELKKIHYFLLPCFTVFAFANFAEKKKVLIEESNFWRFLWIMAAFVSLITVVQFWGHSFFSEKILENRFFRPIAGNPHFHGQGLMNFHLSFASAMGFVYSYACARVFWRKSNDSWAKWTGFLLLSFLVGTAIFYSFSRIAWVAVFVVHLLLGFLRKWRLGILLFFVAFVSIIFLWQSNLGVGGRITEFINTKSNGLQGRLIVWRSAIEMIKDRPLTGVGFGKTGQYSEAYTERYFGSEQWFSSHSHNNMLDAFSSTGIFGLIAYLWWWFALLWLSWRQYREALWDNKWLPAAGIAAFFSFQINGLTQVNFYDAKSQHALMLWVGIVLVLEWQRRGILPKN